MAKSSVEVILNDPERLRAEMARCYGLPLDAITDERLHDQAWRREVEVLLRARFAREVDYEQGAGRDADQV